MNCSPSGSCVHGILQARILECVAISFSRASSRPRDRTRISCLVCLADLFLTTEPPSVQFNSVTQSYSTLWIPWTQAHQASLSITNPHELKLMFIESVIPSSHLILCHPLLLLPSIFHSTRIFSNESALPIRWPKYWSFSISPSNQYSGLISFSIDWLDLLAVQGTLKSLLQHHSSKVSILWHSASCIVQLSHPYMTSGKITLTR